MIVERRKPTREGLGISVRHAARLARITPEKLNSYESGSASVSGIELDRLEMLYDQMSMMLDVVRGVS